MSLHIRELDTMKRAPTDAPPLPLPLKLVIGFGLAACVAGFANGWRSEGPPAAAPEATTVPANMPVMPPVDPFAHLSH